MSETLYLNLVFEWPPDVPSTAYEAGDAAEHSLTFQTGMPLPAPGEQVIFDAEDPPVEGRDHPWGSRSGRRFLVGNVESREWAITESRYEPPASWRKDVEVTLRLNFVRLWAP